VALVIEQQKLIDWTKDRIRPVYGWLEEAGREPWDGPHDDLKNLRSRIELIERHIESCQPPSPDAAFQVLMQSSTGTEQLVLGRILDILKSHGPLKTPAIVDRIGYRSETVIKMLLSKLCKLQMIRKGTKGYFIVQREVRTKDPEK
jgi:hypothetical protein